MCHFYKKLTINSLRIGNLKYPWLLSDSYAAGIEKCNDVNYVGPTKKLKFSWNKPPATEIVDPQQLVVVGNSAVTKTSAVHV